jgi:hypothetical protein
LTSESKDAEFRKRTQNFCAARFAAEPGPVEAGCGGHISRILEIALAGFFEFVRSKA